MSRTRRKVLPFCTKPQPIESTHRGLGDPQPFYCEHPRYENVHGFDGANRDGRHVNTLRRERKAARRSRRFQERVAFKEQVE